jgi:hypothetical protein
MLTPEQIKDIGEMVSHLNEKEQNDLLKMVNSSGVKGMQQFNFGRAKGTQVEVHGGTAYTGNININNNSIDAKSLKKLIKKMIANESSSRGYFPAKKVDFFERTADKLERTIQNYHRYRYLLLSNLGCVRFLVIVPVLIGAGIFFSGILNKTAVVTTSNPKGVNVKDDSANIIGILPNGTIVKLTGEQDSINYCKTNRGWIYCDALVENGPKKIAVVHLDSQYDRADLYSKPISGKIVGSVTKDSEVQIIQCLTNVCEITNGSIKGWIYKPYLLQK